MNTFKYASILLIAMLTACTTHNAITVEQPHGIHAPLTEHKAQLSSLTSWKISGAMAAKNKNKGWTASCDWQQQGLNQYQIRLFGPLGNGAVLIEKDKGIVTYTDGPKKLSSKSADALLQKELGFRLPVNSLYYWVRGIPASGAVQSANYDENNHLISLKQNGFTIDYSNYTTVHGYDLPTKIRLQGNGVLIKLVIKHWSF